MTSPTSSSSAAPATASTKPTSETAATPPTAGSSKPSDPGLILLFSWYSERPDWISAAITSAAGLGVTHVIALDGAYFLLPQGKARSSTYEHLHILELCNALNLGLTLHWPPHPWAGNEVEKRTALFRYADQIAKPGDWLLVWDADELMTNPRDIRARLAATTEDVAELGFTQEERDPDRTISNGKIRKLFRWTPGIYLDVNHFTYKTPDGRTLWGQKDLEPCADFTDLTLEHRTQFRPPARSKQQHTYYNLRLEHEVEAHDCELCGKAKAKANVPVDLEPHGQVNGRQAFAGRWGNVCKDCEPIAKAQVDYKLRVHGCKPEDFRTHAVIA